MRDNSRDISPISLVLTTERRDRPANGPEWFIAIRFDPSVEEKPDYGHIRGVTIKRQVLSPEGRQGKSRQQIRYAEGWRMQISIQSIWREGQMLCLVPRATLPTSEPIQIDLNTVQEIGRMGGNPFWKKPPVLSEEWAHPLQTNVFNLQIQMAPGFGPPELAPPVSVENEDPLILSVICETFRLAKGKAESSQKEGPSTDSLAIRTGRGSDQYIPLEQIQEIKIYRGAVIWRNPVHDSRPFDPFDGGS